MRYERIFFEELGCTLLQHFAYHKVSVGWGSFSYIFPFLLFFLGYHLLYVFRYIAAFSFCLPMYVRIEESRYFALVS